MMPRRCRTFQAGLVVFILLMVTGCQTETLEQLSIIYGIAVEADENDKEKLSGIISIPFYKKDGFENHTVTAQGKTPAEIQNELSLQSSGRLVVGKAQVLLIDEQLARQPVYRFMGFFTSEFNLPASTSLALTETSPKAMLDMSTKNVDPATNISTTISKHERLGIIPGTNLLTFVKQYVREGQDPYLPLVGMENGNNSVKLKGLALFKDDRYVMPLKGAQNLLLFALLEESVSHVLYESENDGLPLIMMFEHSNASYDWNPSEKSMKVRVRVHARLQERTNSPMDVHSEAEKGQLKMKAEQQLAAELDRLVRRFQRNDLDPVGFGEIARSQDRHWKAKEWKAIYPQLKFQTAVSVEFDSERR
ncbi:Ger(x)C family spore germination protein [Paenibacillus montanisoli]|uniref:Ger(X)C family spore germination protein n=1 Tax=Paenibacillus montanisoli TaxID=2081970 RepID=A0A328TS08_9BACL|nr:Ger(x)C family spore germination protein [Paenibacillus montanisoli]RAP73278.1 hypothetical protein DL346_27835 [Paenibacillus montanisoli]